MSSHFRPLYLPPYPNVTCLFKEHLIFFPLSFCHWQFCFLYPFFYSSINFCLYMRVCSLMQAITSFLNLTCFPMPLKMFSTPDLGISTSLNLPVQIVRRESVLCFQALTVRTALGTVSTTRDPEVATIKGLA